MIIFNIWENNIHVPNHQQEYVFSFEGNSVFFAQSSFLEQSVRRAASASGMATEWASQGPIYVKSIATENVATEWLDHAKSSRKLVTSNLRIC